MKSIAVRVTTNVTAHTIYLRLQSTPEHVKSNSQANTRIRWKNVILPTHANTYTMNSNSVNSLLQMLLLYHVHKKIKPKVFLL